MSKRIFIENEKDRNLKRKMVEKLELKPQKEQNAIPPTSESAEEELLTLSLGIHAKSTSKLLESGKHLSMSQNVKGESSSQNAIDKALSEHGSVQISFQNNTIEPLHKVEVREYSCRYCDKKFSNYQSLGGHQNAHKHEREMDPILRSRNQPYLYPFSSPNPYQGNYLWNSNLHYPISAQMKNAMPYLAIGSPSNGYRGFYMPNSSLTTPQFGMTNFLQGNQNVALPTPQRTSNTFGLGHVSHETLTPSIADEGVEKNLIDQIGSQTLQLLSCDRIGGDPIQENSNVSSSTQSTTTEEVNLNLSL